MASSVTESPRLTRAFHPTSLLLFFGAGFFLVQTLPLFFLAGLAVILFALAWWMGRLLLFKTLRRSRWLFLTLFILFLWMTPGVLIGPVYLGLTVDGVQAAAEHGLRLLAVLLVLTLLLVSLPRTRLVEGLYVLIQPLTCLGINTQQIATRLMLTLEMIGGDEKMRWHDFLDGAAEGTMGANASSHTPLTLVLPRWRWQDTALLVVVCGLVVMMFLLGMNA